MREQAVQQGRSERRGESCSALYVEPLNDARTPLADFSRILLEAGVSQGRLSRSDIPAHGFGAPAYLELVEDIGEVIFDGLVA